MEDKRVKKYLQIQLFLSFLSNIGITILETLFTCISSISKNQTFLKNVFYSM